MLINPSPLSNKFGFGEFQRREIRRGMNMAGSCSCVPINGTVYGVALDVDDPFGAPSDLFTMPPYHRAPTAPVLFIKPRNTFLAHGGIALLPSGLEDVEVSAALAVVFARDTRCAYSARALETVAGYTLALDLSEPGADFFRPPIREKCRDGFLPIGPTVVSRENIENLEGLVVRMEIDGKEASSFNLHAGVDRVSALIAEVSSFMTFRAGDVLLVSRTPLGPRARVGNRISAIADGLGRLDCVLERDEEVIL
jgi:5-oxopent-3-ene-1,2,5-tricarboxylate decarboxylase/2-hydroxyhepta-2,4-diene-1,7-dioate isomerase